MEGRSVSFLFINVNHDVGYESSESIPISLGYVLASLKGRGWNGVILDDLRDRPLTLRNLEKWIRRVDPWVVGFTAYQSTMHRIRFLCRYIKSRHRRIHVVLGGPQAILMPSPALEQLEDVDALIRGEGESVVPLMADALDSGQGLERVDGVTCRCLGKIVDTGKGPEAPEDLDAYPSPYLMNLFNLDGKNTAILLSSRGCRHVCRFCITPSVCRGKIRFHSVERVVEEMDLLTRQGIERFWFADPNFTADTDRTMELLEEKMRRGISTPFWCQTRSDLVDAKVLEQLRKAGADTIAFGLESGSPGVLQNTGKGIELEQLRQNISAAQSLGMETELFSIFGLPGETVDDARSTMKLVQSLGIPIQSNSGSQQMQLYFGSLYEKKPERYGIVPTTGYVPLYLSVGEQFETSAMSRAEMRKVRNLWALANEQIKIDVYYKQRIFEIVDFLLENRDDLQDEVAYYAYGALACSAIEEFSLLEEFLEGYRQRATDGDMPFEELLSALSFFQETDEPAEPMDRVIFDSRSYIDGIPFTGISGKYWDVLLGRGLLLPSFEEGFVGASAGEEIHFGFVFPDDYQQEELRGKEVEVQAKIHKVFRSVEVETMEDLKNLRIKNRYLFNDLDLLRDQNEILYYLALRDADPYVVLQTPSHFLMLVHRLSKLGKREAVRELAKMLDGKLTALNALADTLMGAGKFGWALEYYQALAADLPSTLLKTVRSLLSMEKWDDAYRLMEGLDESPSLEFQETLLQCLRAARPHSKRIPSLEHHVLNLRVTAALTREAASRVGQSAAPPIVHGYEEEDYE
jgi:anaerobic magnesium-protoporphyrin IX monomethyl ester cyclase